MAVERKKTLTAEREAALALALFLDTVGRPVRLPPRELGPRDIWRLPLRPQAALLGLRAAEKERLAGLRRSFNLPEVEEGLRRAGVLFLPRGDDLYPDRLEQIPDPPPGLFARCRPLCRDRLEAILRRERVAVVGARAASRYGIDVAGMLGHDLGLTGVCVVSGMAMGIDAAAQRGALTTPGGSIAVLGGGVDSVYPAENHSLYRRLLRHGAVLSEYPPGSRPRPWRFPARNRIIAGISRAVVVVEARERSGSLITADFCLEQGGEVCAVPGSIFSDLSHGPNNLIREGALAVTAAEDLLGALGMVSQQGMGEQENGQRLPGIGPQQETEANTVGGTGPGNEADPVKRTGPGNGKQTVIVAKTGTGPKPGAAARMVAGAKTATRAQRGPGEHHGTGNRPRPTGPRLPSEVSGSSARVCLSDDERKMMAQLDGTPRQTDALAAAARLSSRAAAACLVSLEIKGLARHEQGRGYSR
jgi:DNA processing protein